MSYTVGASKSGSCAFTIPVLYVIELFVQMKQSTLFEGLKAVYYEIEVILQK
jgi:hypothetical protein